ncbi:sensor histidine kinase [Celeribacter sp. ULVN23_4]
MKHVRVLIVDDDEGDRKQLKRLLSKVEFDVSVHEACCAEESFALDLHEVDAVFLDYLFPGDTGLGRLGHYRARWPRAALFFMTGQGDEDLAKTSIKFGATDYIAKCALTEKAVQRMMDTGLAQAEAQWRIEEQRLDLATFSEVLVHDFKAPIRAASYLSEQIEEDLTGGDIDAAVEGLRLLRASAEQMQDMIQSLADHVRLDRDVECLDVTAEELCRRALLALDREIVVTGAKVAMNVSEAALPFLCRPLQLVQVLQNLIANALKYNGNRPPDIRISARFDDAGNVRFEVRDKGTGVPKDQIERIFEPFKRGPETRQLAGTGLGLATCRKIIARHNGKIWCSSEPGEGATFGFLIPSAQRQSDRDMSVTCLDT